MTSLVQAIPFVLIALVPGALHTWALERQTPLYENRLRDRIVQYVGVSATYLVVSAGPLYWWYANHWDGFTHGRASPWWVWAFIAAYVGIPFLVGTWIGHDPDFLRRTLPSVARRTSPKPPTAWDHLFQPVRTRARPRSGSRMDPNSAVLVFQLKAGEGEQANGPGTCVDGRTVGRIRVQPA